MQYLRNTNKSLVLLCMLASGYGILLVYSAALSLNYSGPKTVIMQILATAAGLIAALVIAKFDYESICNLWPVWAVIAFVLVFLTYTPLGLNVQGTDDTAWLAIPVIGTFQPAELMKIAFIITFSKHLVAVREQINRPLTVLLLILHGAVPILMVMKQGDDGTALVFRIRESACSGDCHKCSGCGAAKETVTFTAKNPIGARRGELVKVESETAPVLKAAAVLYVVPLVLFFSGYYLGFRFGGSPGVEYAG